MCPRSAWPNIAAMEVSGDRSGPRVAKGVAGILVAVVVLNVLPRLVPLPDVDVPALSLPDLPGWVETVNDVKRWLMIAGVVLLVAIGIWRR